MSVDNLSNATRELHVRSVVDSVFYRLPFLEELKRRRQITFKGGKYIDRLMDTAEIDDLAQDYDANTALTDGQTDTLDKPYFRWKKSQVPLRFTCDDEIQNIHALHEEQLLNLKTFRLQYWSLPDLVWKSNLVCGCGCHIPFECFFECQSCSLLCH